MIVISDTTPLISLLKINRLDLLEKIFGKVLIPEGVFYELTENKIYEREAEKIINSKFIDMKKVLNKEAIMILERTTSLDRGESEAIILFGEINAQLLLMDEKRGRKVAEKLNIPLSGTLGVLMLAFDKGLITREQVHEYLNIFQRQSRRFNSSIINLVKTHVGYE